MNQSRKNTILLYIIEDGQVPAQPWHPEAAKIQAHLAKNGIGALYHFTAVDNLGMIYREGGLRSKADLEAKNLLPKVITGGNQLSLSLDQYQGNYDKVSLSFCPKIPMAFHVEKRTHLCYIVISPRVCALPGVIFTDRNATDNHHQKAEGFAGLQLVDFRAVRACFPYSSKEEKKKKQAEVLISDLVRIGHFQEVVFANRASQEEGKRLTSGLNRTTPFNVKPEFFIRQDDWPMDFRLTTQTVTRENVNGLNFLHRQQFRLADKQATLVTKVNVTIGTKERIRWKDADGNVLSQTSKDFTRAGPFFTWTMMPLTRTGKFCVEYCLETQGSPAIQYFSLQFEVR